VDDGATVPLFYENRTPALQLINQNLNDDIYQVIEEAELNPEAEEKIQRILGKQYHLITRDDRLDTVAKDIVSHFLGRGFVGKAMVVSIDKATALKMFAKVQKFWQQEKERVAKEIGQYNESRPEYQQLYQRLNLLNSTDMAVVVSPGQNEIAEMKKLGLDIAAHRRRMNDSQPPLAEKFKDPSDPLRLVFVCAMWLTGFDAPSCSTIYLDKPMRNHTLMQTIARANRVFPGKHSGVIVDYANVFASLEKALAIYGAGLDGANPVRDKQELVQNLEAEIKLAARFCASKGVDLDHVESFLRGDMKQIQAIADAVERLIAPDETRNQFYLHERLLLKLYRAVQPDPVAARFSLRVSTIAKIAEVIRTKRRPEPTDIRDVLIRIGDVLDQSIAGISIREAPAHSLNLSAINFEELAKRFQKSKHKNTELEALKAAIRARLEIMMQVNRTRADFKDKFEKLIEDYNNGSLNIEQLFQDLLNLSNSLDNEDERHVRENLTQEELVIFDILTRPAPELSTAERDEIKKIAKHLLLRIKSLLVLDWRKSSQARSSLRLAIEDDLDTALPRSYDQPLYEEKCSALFEHVYESYPNLNQSIYTTA
jgi:type I restriction enzyme R subunit